MPATNPCHPSPLRGRAAFAVAVLALSAGVGLAAAPGAAAVPAASLDDEGFTGTAARCDDSQTPAAFARTSRSLIAICKDADGDYEYHGVRMTDGASLSAPAKRDSDGDFLVTNSDITYTISPTELVISQNGEKIRRGDMLQYVEPEPDSPTTARTSKPAKTSANWDR